MSNSRHAAAAVDLVEDDDRSIRLGRMGNPVWRDRAADFVDRTVFWIMGIWVLFAAIVWILIPSGRDYVRHSVFVFVACITWLTASWFHSYRRDRAYYRSQCHYCGAMVEGSLRTGRGGETEILVPAVSHLRTCPLVTVVNIHDQ